MTPLSCSRPALLVSVLAFAQAETFAMADFARLHCSFNPTMVVMVFAP